MDIITIVSNIVSFVLVCIAASVVVTILQLVFEPRRWRWPKRLDTPAGELMVFECGATLLRDKSGDLRIIMLGAKRPAPGRPNLSATRTPAPGVDET